MSLDHPGHFYVVGGTLQGNAPSYVARRADEDLYRGLRHGKLCYVLTSRQMGKSSLMVRTAARLRQEGAAVAILDLTAIGQNLDAEQWYDGLLGRAGQQLRLEDELDDFWLENDRRGPLQRWMAALCEVVLREIRGPIVIFVDEIDAVRSLPFSTDEFFAGIRELYNRRTEDHELARLTFCLLGVATPSDLVRDTRTTPFNIGQRIELTDFAETEAAPLATGLERPGSAGAELLKRILYWTGGHPYLTQRLCQAVADDPRVRTSKGVDQVCEELFLSAHARERDDNLLFVRERMLRGEADRAALLDLYRQVRQGKRVADDDADPLVGILRLSGIARVTQGRLVVRNRIYQRVFDQHWIIANMPDAELRRQRAAYRRGVLRAAGIAAVILLVLAGLAIAVTQQRNRAMEEARRADRNARSLENALAELRTALGEAKSQREEADRQRQIAEEQEAIARAQQQIAQDKSQQAVEQQEIAAAGRREAEQQRAHALAAQKTAEAERQLASARASDAEKQRQRAEAQTRLATSTLFKVIRFLEQSNEKQRVIPYYDELASIYHEVADRDNEAETLITIGGLYRGLKDEQKARDYFTKAAGIFSGGNIPEEAHTLIKIGDVYHAAGETALAGEYYRRALALIQDRLPALGSEPDRKPEAYALYYLALAYKGMGDAQKAIENCRRALRLFRSLRDGVMMDIVQIQIEELSQPPQDRQ